MPTNEDAWWSALAPLIDASWPEITAVERSSSINRANWENLVLGNELRTPYAIVELGPQTQEDWGTDNQSFRQPVFIYYVCDAEDPGAAIGGDPANGFDVQAFVLDKLHALRIAMIAYATGGFQIAATHPTVDVSETNPANAVFYSLEAIAKFGGQLSAQLLVGDSNIAS